MQYIQADLDPQKSLPAALPQEAAWLVGTGAVSYDAAVSAYETSQLHGVCCGSVLISDHNLSEHQVAHAMAKVHDAAQIDPTQDEADPALLAEFGLQAALHRLVLPWRRVADATIVLTARPDHFHLHLPALRATFGEVRMGVATASQIRKSIFGPFATTLAQAAEQKVVAEDSCRKWRAQTAFWGLAIFSILFAVIAAYLPNQLFAALTLWAVIILGMMALLNLAALGAVHFGPAIHPVLKVPDRLPTISLLVPLYHEQDIAGHLIKRLSALEYPRSLLDVCLVLESSDDTTHAAVSQTNLPHWARTLVVPDGTLKTKPRALNYALESARGSIIGVYDAEDAPERSQLLVVAQRFAEADNRTACLQGTLDYYNPKSNWLTRCFTIEYAGWFRVVLPGFARLGLAVPLGGTTLFFRRDILEKLGGWDAHNVTEDADLGLRLARKGYVTEFIPTVTEEEANGHAWPWIRQRSRWLKGYAMTYIVHMRRPLTLWRDLGAWKFFGVQMLFLGTLTQFLLAPLLWSFWLIPLGGTHPLSALMAPWVVIACTATCVASAAINLTIQYLGVKRAGKGWLAPWTLSMLVYFPLGTMAVYKGLLELVWRPFFWDKTAHGILMPQRPAIRPPRQPRHQVSAVSYMPD